MRYRLKYYSLSKSEKIKLKEKFYKTDFGKSIKVRLDRLVVTGSMSILVSIGLLLLQKNTWDLLSGIILLLAGLFFVVASFRVRVIKLNDFLVKIKKI